MIAHTPGDDRAFRESISAKKIEHKPWCGNQYRAGIKGQKVAIVGHSHYERHPDLNTEDFTIETVGGVLNGTNSGRNSFYPNVPKYFGYRGDRTFWEKVLHFNYLPDRIGDISARYKKGSPEPFERALPRFRSILDQYLPDKVFIFTPEVWNLRPILYDVISLDRTFPSGSWKGKYRAGDHIARVYRLRHPQGAPDSVMIPSVRSLLNDN